jgi:CheY-like chemotaxis protein
VTINFDITARKEAELQLQKATDEAKGAAAAKSEFLANISHEIRTPLNGILGYTAHLMDQNLNQDQLKSAKIIRDSGEYLLSLINDFLDYSKIDANKLNLEKAPFDVRQIFSGVKSMFYHMALEKRVEIHLIIDSNSEYCFYGDSVRFRQILVNLVSNSIKFTENGDIWIRYKTNSEQGRQRISCSIQDNGIGIAEKVQTKLFGVFQQADSSTTRKYGGTGLGLAICKKLVEAMDGEIWVESQLTKGSTFHFTLCLPTASQSDLNSETLGSSTQTATRIPPMSILVAEDNHINQKLVSLLLEKIGQHADVVGNGLLALKAIASKKYDVVLMDVSMPEMDGIEATKRICATIPASSRPQIVALTANVSKRDREECHAAGMDHFLTKPIKLDDLHATLKMIHGENKKSENEPTWHPEKKYDYHSLTESIFNHKKFAAKFEGMEEIAQDLIQNFELIYQKNLFDIRQALEKKDEQQIKFSLHSYKGIVANFCSEKIYLAISLLERKAHEDIDALEEDLSRIELDSHELVKILSNLYSIDKAS